MHNNRPDFFKAFKKKPRSGKYTANEQQEASFSSIDISITDLKSVLRQKQEEHPPVPKTVAPEKSEAKTFVDRVQTFESSEDLPDVPLYELKPRTTSAKTISKEDIMREIREKARAQMRSSYAETTNLEISATETVVEPIPKPAAEPISEPITAPTKFHETLDRVAAQETPIKETIYVPEEDVGGTITLTEHVEIAAMPAEQEQESEADAPITATVAEEIPTPDFDSVFGQKTRPTVYRTGFVEAVKSFIHYVKKERNRKAVALFASIVAALIIVGTFTANFSFAYAARINGNYIGIVRDKNQCEAIIAEINTTLTSAFGEAEKVSYEITVSPCIVRKNGYTSDEELRNSIYALSDKMLEMYVIYAGKTQICALGSREDAEDVLKQLELFYTHGDESIEFSTEVPLEIKAELAPVTLLREKQEAFDLLNGTEKTEGEYTVKAGDTLWAIARAYDTTVDDLLSLNPDATETIDIGDKLRVMAYDPIVAVTTITRVEYDETINYTTEVVETESMYRGRSSIVQKGANGKRHVVADLVKVNGLEVRRDVVTETILVAPVTQIKHVGITEPPKGYGTGSFIRPCSGTISSYFGTRRSGYHKGIDIANSYGTPIYAADNGKVIFSGWDNTGFGRLVKLDHQNGYISYYGHNSSIVVKVGQTVNKGDVIAYMGSTGNSTGNHCHFELYKDGQLLNPYSYIF